MHMENKIIVKEIEIKKIKPAAYNPRKNLQPGDSEYEKLRASIERFDLVEPLVWNEATGNLVGGHQRLKICKERGDSVVKTVVVNLSPTKERLLNIALNRISGEWDFAKLSELMQEFTPEDLGITGFSQLELDELLGGASASQNETIEAIESASAAGNSIGTEAEENACCVYLSFNTKRDAEKWLSENGYKETFRGITRTVVLNMRNDYE